ncbi:putative membrane-associated Zn-dependent protease [Aciduliprofundum sp. MAR08-339]|uniref:site-2 protease family protein n=1 Tax=Aciduliprofundum sp. (strain MAR08-339) TaxID=673860 RepID=UPI0002A4C4A5|nr:putative membrane-associated Zn-dependent protease [Aciduliprofundum sp. MAR08-339]
MINPEVEEVNLIVRRYLNVYDFRITPDHLEFYFTPGDENEFEKNFEKLRLELKKRQMVPIVRKETGEYVLVVIRTPPRKFLGLWVNIVLLLATLASTIWVGMGYYVTYYGPSTTLNEIVGGFVYFALPLMTILGVHEMGHYFAARRHNVMVSLPFFIPAPTLLGTLGAFISVREPIPDKKALVDIGLAGPIAGFIVAIPVTLLGMYLGTLNPPTINITETNRYILLNVPIIYNVLSYFMPSPEFIHPMAMAGWVGFVVTAINLFPIGQLDGGHVARAIAGDNTKYVSYAFAAILFILGIWYPGWIIFALLVVFLGLNHPPPLNDITKLDKKRWALAISGFLLLAVTFVPVPMQMVTLHEDMQLSVNLNGEILVENLENSTTLHIMVVNNGEMKENTTVTVRGDFYISNSTYNFVLDPGGSWNGSVVLKLKESGVHGITVSLLTRSGYVREWHRDLLCLNESRTLHFEPESVHSFSFNTTLVNNGNISTVQFMTLNGVYFNITSSSLPILENGTMVIPENSSAALHFVVMGKTTILAVDLLNYQAAWIQVRV